MCNCTKRVKFSVVSPKKTYQVSKLDVEELNLKLVVKDDNI